MKEELNIFAISLPFQSVSQFLHFLSISAPLLSKLFYSEFYSEWDRWDSHSALAV
jgi:hypothetical protein